MSQSFEKGVRVCLVLMFIFAAIFAHHVHDVYKQMNDVVVETAARTRHLRDRIVELEARVKALDEKAGVAPKGAAAASPAKP